MNLEGHIPTPSLHSDTLEPPDESSGPVTVEEFFRKMDAIKEKHRFNLILTSSLFSNHTQTGPDQAPIFQLRPRRNIDSFKFPTAETSGEFPAVHRVPFLGSFFVFSRNIGWIDHHAVDSLLLELVMNPETTVTSLISRMIGSSWKVAFQVIGKLLHFGRLGKCFMLTMLRKNAHAPALFVDIQSDVNMLTRKINSVTVNHGKPPFAKILLDNKIIAENMRLAFLFVRKVREASFSGVIHRGVENGEILAQRSSCGAGRARRAKSRSSRSTLWITLLDRYVFSIIRSAKAGIQKTLDSGSSPE
jgi:hypothetical protein